MRRLYALIVIVLLGVPLFGTPLVVVADETGRTVSAYDSNGLFRFNLTVPGVTYGLPTAAAFTEDGTEIWVSDFYSHTVYQFSSQGAYRGSYTNSAITTPVGLAFNGDNLVVTNRDGNSVCEFNLSGGTPACSPLTQPRGVVAGNGHVYVSSSGVNRLNAYSTIGGAPAFGVDVKAPRAVAIDAAGFVYVTEADATHGFANLVVRYDSNLTPSTRTVFATYSGASTEPGWNGLGFDSAGNLYVSAYFERTVTRFDSTGHNPVVIRTAMSNPSGLMVGEGVPEPGSMLTLGLGLISLAVGRRAILRRLGRA